MMPAEKLAGPLIERLPSVRGHMDFEEPLARFTWFKVGGIADALFRPADVDDLGNFLSACPKDIPIMVMGNASNMLVRDGGIRGVVIRLGRPFQGLRIDGTSVHAGAAAVALSIARAANDVELGGLEFLAGIPGTIGGAVFMNSGAYGNEIKDVFISCNVVSRNGVVQKLPFSEISFQYRQTSLTDNQIVTSVELSARPSDPDTIRSLMRDVQAVREASQPIRSATGGSTFKNPPDAPAWELIDAAGCRGLRMGGAVVSEKHCNFLVNAGGATAADLEMLGEEIRRRVMAKTGIQLEWEIRRVGQPNKNTHGEPR